MRGAALLLSFGAVACGSTPAAPDAAVPVLARGPERSVRDDRICTYHYDDADRLSALDIEDVMYDFTRTVEYTWDGDQLAAISDPDALDEVTNDADGAHRTRSGTTTWTYDARFELPLVLDCQTLTLLDFPDHLVAREGTSWRDDYTYTGVAPGEEGTRLQTATHTPPFPDFPPSGYISGASFTYDANGRLVDHNEEVEDEPGRSYELAWRDDGRPSVQTANVDDVPLAWTFGYDAAGNLLTVDLDRDGELSTEVYEY